MNYFESETRSTGKQRLSCLESCKSCDPALRLTLAGSLPPRTKLVLNSLNGSKPHSQGPGPWLLRFWPWQQNLKSPWFCPLPWLFAVCGAGITRWDRGLQPEELGTDDVQGAVSPTFSIRVLFMLNGVLSNEYVLITKPSLSPGSETVKGR